MKNQRGFTLLEIILALVIFASCAMMVVSTIPSRSGADIFGQQLKALVDYCSDRAVMDGNIVGLVIATDKYQLVLILRTDLFLFLHLLICKCKNP